MSLALTPSARRVEQAEDGPPVKVWRHDREVLADIITSHQERAVVRLADVFVKVDTSDDRVGRELAALGSAPVPTPQLLWHRAGPIHLLALSEVQGVPLGRYGSTSDSPSAAWSAAGAIARQLHEHQVPAALELPSRYRLENLDELEEWLLAKRVADPGLVAEHARRARAASEEATNNSLVHGDFQPEHVIVTADNTVAGVLDWGDAGVGDPHMDLAVLTVGHREHLDAVLDGYRREVDRERISGYWSWRRLGSIRWMLNHGFDASGDVTALSRL